AGLLPAVEPDMLVTADRNFYSYQLWSRFRESGADLLWRMKSNIELPIVKWLPDGSYLSLTFDPKTSRRLRDRLTENARTGESINPEQARLVRIVEYDIPDREGNGKGELICLMSSILDPSEATAVELAAAYHERWEFEGLIDEIKTHQRG